MNHQRSTSAFGIAGLQEITAFFSIQWLVLANFVGILLAAMLIWPQLNSFLSPFSYGRWVPLHMDWHLYGWSSLPLLGLIHLVFSDKVDSMGRWIWLSHGLWSLSLLVGGVAWLAGHSTGKLFLDWSGPAGFLFAATLVIIWTLLFAFWLQSASRAKYNKILLPGTIVKGLILLCLVGMPFILLHTSHPEVYPPVNPDSGGATGHSLLASTLGIVFLMGLLPLLLPQVIPGPKAGSRAVLFWTAFALSTLVYLLINHGNASNHEANQVIGLGTLLAWPVLTAVYWKQFGWGDGAAIWRQSFFFWWAFLVLDGWILFLPDMLQVMKFTNALVAHSHLAMAGMVSSLNMLILNGLGNSSIVRTAIASRTAFWLWNSGCLVFVLAMTLQGWREGTDPAVLTGHDPYTTLHYLIRFLSGTCMLTASIYWIHLLAGGPRHQAGHPEPLTQ